MVLAISGKLQHRTVSENVIHDIMQITQITHIIQIRHFMHKEKDLLVQDRLVPFKPKMILNFFGLAQH